MPVSIVISYCKKGAWSIWHRGLAVVSLTPAVIIAYLEASKPYGTNGSWLYLLIASYIALGISAVTIPNKPAEQEGEPDS